MANENIIDTCKTKELLILFYILIFYFSFCFNESATPLLNPYIHFPFHVIYNTVTSSIQVLLMLKPNTQ